MKSKKTIGIGGRIRIIRQGRGLTQAELGKRVGLPGDRIQKYESGNRVPKPALLGKIADALKVELRALTNSEISDPMGVIYTLFELQRFYQMTVRMMNGKPCLFFDDPTIEGMLKDWEGECRKTKERLICASSKEEESQIMDDYMNWTWTYIDRGEVKDEQNDIKEG